MKDDTCALISFFFLNFQADVYNHFFFTQNPNSTRQNLLGQKTDISHLFDSHFLHEINEMKMNE